MPNDNLLTDEYVAELLAKEADDCSLKYSSMGMDAFRTDKKPANLPKPNTRFLRHIIKDTNTHNKNLLAKEAAESRARLKDLEHADEKERRRKAGPQDIRRRQMGDIKAILGDRKDTPGRAGRADKEKPQTKDEPSPRRRHPHRERRSASPERGGGARHRRSRRDGSDSERDDRRRHKGDRRRSRSPEEASRRHRHRSPLGGRDPTSKPHRGDKQRSRGETAHELIARSLRTRRERSRERPQGGGFSIKGGSGRRERERESAGGGGGGDMSDSDPLDDFIGPAPAQQVRSRGRGAAAGTSGIDKRFETDYDPKADVETAEDAAGAGDWDDAVEAFRDRQKWRQNQEQRMRAAGYSDETIKKWREGGEQRDERDVRWAKAGEKREWDRGKEEEGVSGLFSEFN
ncbi:pre-mRNA-splicing factor 38b [Colletotrichum graminicola]|nr:pre-mRNA-splicing factor 38b [Colletotrichum graminicola]